MTAHTLLYGDPDKAAVPFTGLEPRVATEPVQNAVTEVLLPPKKRKRIIRTKVRNYTGDFGSVTRVKIPEGTETGKQFRLKGKGMPVLRSKTIGDMYIQVEVETPKSLTRRQRDLLEEFERESHKDTSPQSAGFFSKVKEFFEG